MAEAARTEVVAKLNGAKIPGGGELVAARAAPPADDTGLVRLDSTRSAKGLYSVQKYLIHSISCPKVSPRAGHLAAALEDLDSMPRPADLEGEVPRRSAFMDCVLWDLYT